MSKLEFFVFKCFFKALKRATPFKELVEFWE